MHKRTEGNSLKYESLFDISGNLEQWALRNTVRSPLRRKEKINLRLLRTKTTKMLTFDFFLYFSRLLMSQRIPEVEIIKYVKGFLASNERFSEHFCWPMELMLALGISGFILINPLNFRALSVSNILNVLCVHYRDKAKKCSGRIFGNKYRTGLKNELFHRERPKLNALQFIQ